jgi:hypothetical protein
MNEIPPQPVSILVIEDDSGDFGLIRAHVQLSGLVSGGDKEPVVWAKTLADGLIAAQSKKPVPWLRIPACIACAAMS